MPRPTQANDRIPTGLRSSRMKPAVPNQFSSKHTGQNPGVNRQPDTKALAFLAPKKRKLAPPLQCQKLKFICCNREALALEVTKYYFIILAMFATAGVAQTGSAELSYGISEFQ